MPEGKPRDRREPADGLRPGDQDDATSPVRRRRNFELNVMMPVMAADLLDSIELLAAGTTNFATRLIDGLEADRDGAESYIEQSLAMGTALAPEIGYEKAAALVKQAYHSGRTIREVAREQSGIAAERLAELLDAEAQADAGR